jgi:hypothetical protein
MFSGGVGSYCAAKRVVEKQGSENVTLLFADTKIEDEDLYRFLHESASKLGARLEIIAEGRTPWEVFKDRRYIGNSRVDLCSETLKRNLMDKWVKEHFEPHEVVCYVGIDWNEEHRFLRMQPRKLPYVYQAPLLDPPLLLKEEMRTLVEEDGLEQPRLYKLGFAHNNCGGFCVKAGQGSFARLLRTMPERYRHHEQKEQELREHLCKDVTILRIQRNNKKHKVTLRQFREMIEEGKDIDELDIGGCGCAID